MNDRVVQLSEKVKQEVKEELAAEKVVIKYFKDNRGSFTRFYKEYFETEPGMRWVQMVLFEGKSDAKYNIWEKAFRFYEEELLHHAEMEQQRERILRFSEAKQV